MFDLIYFHLKKTIDLKSNSAHRMRSVLGTHTRARWKMQQENAMEWLVLVAVVADAEAQLFS